MSFDPSGVQVDAYVPDRLIGGDKKLVTREVTLTNLGAAGALSRGAVLGTITADARYGLSAAAAVDGSAVPTAILAKDADPSGGDVTALVYVEGQFNAAELSFGAGHDADSVRELLQPKGIHLKEPVNA